MIVVRIILIAMIENVAVVNNSKNASIDRKGSKDSNVSIGNEGNNVNNGGIGNNGSKGMLLAMVANVNYKIKFFPNSNDKSISAIITQE